MAARPRLLTLLCLWDFSVCLLASVGLAAAMMGKFPLKRTDMIIVATLLVTAPPATVGLWRMRRWGAVARVGAAVVAAVLASVLDGTGAGYYVPILWTAIPLVYWQRLR